MTRERAKARATARRAELKANVDAFYADAITHEAFSERNRATWDAIVADGSQVQVRVLALMRGDVDEFESLR